MDEHANTARLALECQGRACLSRIIPIGSSYVVSGDGKIYCSPCAESPSLETIADVAGSWE
jgi:hypothetical protein